jgi:hypothetical protein
MDVEMLRCAQHDSTDTPAASCGCHPEPFAAAQGKLREGSVAIGSEMLYCAQHDSARNRTHDRMIVLKDISKEGLA